MVSPDPPTPGTLPTKNKSKKRVFFEITKTQYIEQRPFTNSGEDEDAHGDEEEKDAVNARWYSAQELVESRKETRLALEALQAVAGDIALADTTRFCFRGIEKFGDVMSKVQTQRLVKDTVLNHQRKAKEASRNGDDKERAKASPEQLAVLSRYLSQPSRVIAHQFAVMSFQEMLQETGGDKGRKLLTGRPSTPTTQVVQSSLGHFAPARITPTPDSPSSGGAPPFMIDDSPSVGSKTHSRPRSLLSSEEEYCRTSKRARIEVSSARSIQCEVADATLYFI